MVWNCRGVLSPKFRQTIMHMVKKSASDILIVTETRIRGDCAKEITDRLPFDGAIRTDTIGYTGGLWVLWNSAAVEVSHIASTEQEIHDTVKVSSSNLSWLLTTIYASPRFQERSILWNNLMEVAANHNLPWIMMGDFNEVLMGSEKFEGRPSLNNAITSFTTSAKVWNKEVFGNIIARKRNIEARLRGIQVANGTNPSQVLIDLEKLLLRDYAELQRIEEEYWVMKSRIEWMVQGDRNNTFYHTSIISRRKRNQINALIDSNGVWLKDPGDLATHVREGFMSLFTSNMEMGFRRP
ncbi:uncharacterized protein LOC142628410 [Castanea sativa]|uniref:uncharacterized protein LOC142628410 n=1 Tax=Castanea sativa TaxID=21020 RepID=UPI003F65046B